MGASAGDSSSPSPALPAPPPAAVRRAKFARRLDDYPAHYQALLSLPAPPVQVRALKWWIAAGKDATPPELPPLDEPHRLRDWWSRHKSQRAPDWLVALAALAPAADASAATPPPASTAAPVSADPLPASATSSPASAPDAPPLAPADPALGPLFSAPVAPPAPPSPSSSASAPPPIAPPRAVPGSGYAGALDRIRDAEARAGELYSALLKKSCDLTLTADDRARFGAEAEAARRSWDDLVNRLRAMEKDAPQIFAGSAELWKREDVLTALTTVHITVRESFRSMWRRVRVRIRSAPTPEEEELIWQEEVENTLGPLRESRFTAASLPWSATSR